MSEFVSKRLITQLRDNFESAKAREPHRGHRVRQITGGRMNRYIPLKKQGKYNVRLKSSVGLDISQPYAGTAINYSATTTAFFIAGTAGALGITITLPSAVGVSGKMYSIKKVDAAVGAIRVNPVLLQTIDGAPNVVLAIQWQVVRIISDGANWLTW